MSIKKIDRQVISPNISLELDSKVSLTRLNEELAKIQAQIVAITSGKIWMEAVDTFEDIMTTYPQPKDGWTVVTLDTDYTYRFDGTRWIAISSNSIPIATSSVDGLATKEHIAKLDGIEKGSQRNLTASETLEQIKGVGGEGSGLDADTLDGRDSTDFANAIHDHDGRYYTQQQVNISLGNKADKVDATVTKSGLMSPLDKQRANGVVHNQVSATALWIIQHNLDKFPTVSVVDSGGSTVLGDVVYDSKNQITVKFSSAFSGTAYID